jgi:hypothetical protein
VLDRQRLAEAIKSAGIDPRHWVSYGTVATTDGSEQVNYTDPLAVLIGPMGVEVDVVLEPCGIPITCHYAGIQGGSSATIVAPVHPGDQVLVVLPDGDLMGPPVITCVLHSMSEKVPAGPDRKSLFKNDRVLVYAKNVPVDIRTAGGARVEVNQDGTVVLNEGTKGVARLDDTARLTMSPADIQTLAVALLTTGGFTPAAAPAPAATPVTFTDGVITGASATVKAGD